MTKVAVKPESLVLVVEDEAESRDTLRELLEFEGYTVRTASDGKAALEILESITPASFCSICSCRSWTAGR